MKPKKRREGIHIQRSPKNKKFFVDEVASNGNILQASETVNRKQSAFKNILAMGKLFAAVLAGKEYVFDEKGDKWMYNVKGPNKGKFTNTSVSLRKILVPPLVKLAKSVAKDAGKDIVITGPRGGKLLDTRKKKPVKKSAKKK